LHHNYETFKAPETDACNVRFQRNISLLFGRMGARWSVEFNGVEITGGGEIVTLVEKAAAGLHTMRVEHELCAV
jgi:hypothetical protein